MKLTDVLARAALWLHRKPAPVPLLVELKITRLRAAVRRGGHGSDIAAAELRGITETVMALGGVQNRAIGWRGGR